MIIIISSLLKLPTSISPSYGTAGKLSETAERHLMMMLTLTVCRYFNYDSSTSDHHDSIMADMLAGQWYAHACGLSSLVVSSDMAFSCLETIYENNVIKFGQGKLLGAVNGMRPASNTKAKPEETASVPEAAGIWNYFVIPATETNKTKVGTSQNPTNDVDTSCIQSKEVWTGTTYALAALMLHEANYLEKEYHKQLSHRIHDPKKHVRVDGSNQSFAAEITAHWPNRRKCEARSSDCARWRTPLLAASMIVVGKNSDIGKQAATLQAMP
jgi:hypothetical protein